MYIPFSRDSIEFVLHLSRPVKKNCIENSGTNPKEIKAPHNNKNKNKKKKNNNNNSKLS